MTKYFSRGGGAAFGLKFWSWFWGGLHD